MICRYPCQKLNEVIRFLLTATRLVLHEIPPALTAISAKFQPEAGIVRAASTAKQKTFKIISSPSSDELILGAAPQSLGEFIDALFGNAIKFSEVCGFIRAGIGGTGQRDRFLLCFDDGGLGIQVEMRKILLKPVLQMDKSGTCLHGGAGFGLVVVRRVCEGHTASVEIAPGTEGGTRVVAIFPTRVFTGSV